jgi:hypothetical protein
MHVVGGVAILVDGDFPATSGQSSSEPPDITVRLTAERASPPFRPRGEPAVEQDSWVAFVDGDRLSLCTKEPEEAMRIELGRTALEGRYFYDKPWPFPYRYPMDQLLVVHALGIAGGALMHAAAIAGRDGALLVAGPSGAGKTTMSRAAAAHGASVLSDERTILRPANPSGVSGGGGWLLGGTPWPGEGNFADNRSVPLRGLILLEQADRDELIPVSAARALALLYRCHFPPAWDPAAAERTLCHLERAVREVPAFVFKNRKGPEAARLLLACVRGPGTAGAP